MALKRTGGRGPRKTPPAAEPLVSMPEDEPTDAGEGDFEDVAERVRDREADGTPARRAAQEKREQEALTASSSVTVETAIRGIADLKVKIDSTLAGLGETLVEQAKKLALLEEAVSVRTRRLAELYDIEIAADTLARLVRDHEQKTREFADAAAAQKRAFEAEMAEKKASWEKAKERWAEDLEAEKTDKHKQWEREQEEYDYGLRTRRAREEAEYKAKRDAATAKLAEEKARQEADLSAREQAVAAREEELADLRTRVDAFQGEIDRAVQKAVAEATRLAEEKARHEAALKQKDAEAAEKLNRQQVQALEKAVKDQAGRIEQLQAELKEATDKVRDIAMKAIEGASGATALTRVSEIALQQAKGREGKA